MQLSDIRIHGSRAAACRALAMRVDRLTRARLDPNRPELALHALSVARFDPPLSLVLAGIEQPDGNYTPDRPIADAVPHAAAALDAVRDALGDLPGDQELLIALEIDQGVPSFVAWLRRPPAAGQEPRPREQMPPAPVGQPAASVAQWFALASSQAVPNHDGSLGTARKAVEAFVQRGKADNTRRAYRSAVRAWCQWAAGHALPALPARAEDVAAYLADMALRNRTPRTIDLHRAALRYLHHLARLTIPTTHPLVSATLAGIRREAPAAGPQQKTALTWTPLTRVLDEVQGDDLASIRDRAILLLGFAGAFRRSELAGLTVADVSVDDDGMEIRLTRSKGDPNRDGVRVGIPRGVTRHCPVRAYEGWLRAAAITEGAVFRRVWLAPDAKAGTPSPRPKIGSTALSDRAIAEIVRKHCQAAGLEGSFAGHSLRRGAISTGAGDGYDLLELKRFSRHQSLRLVETYIDAASIRQRHPGRSRF